MFVKSTLTAVDLNPNWSVGSQVLLALWNHGTNYPECCLCLRWWQESWGRTVERARWEWERQRVKGRRRHRRDWTRQKCSVVKNHREKLPFDLCYYMKLAKKYHLLAWKIPRPTKGSLKKYNCKIPTAILYRSQTGSAKCHLTIHEKTPMLNGLWFLMRSAWVCATHLRASLVPLLYKII